VSSH